MEKKMSSDIAAFSIESKSSNTKAFTVENHPHHSRIARITLDDAILDAFFAATESIDVQNLEYVPFMRFMLARQLIDLAGEEFAKELRVIVADRSRGAFTLGVQGRRHDHASFVKLGTAIGHLLGPANHDSMSGTFYARFLVKDTDASDSYLRQAYRLFTLHTDGTFVDEATDWLLMMKFAEENAVGGESRLLHLDDWEERDRFANDPLGRRNFVYKAPGSKNIAHNVERPLFFDSVFGQSVSFIDQFVQPATIEEAAFLHDFSLSMERSPATVELPLPVGELVVANNYFWLHGRAAFQQHPDLYRELMRQRGSFGA
jgi:glutarate dioxygenase